MKQKILERFWYKTRDKFCLTKQKPYNFLRIKCKNLVTLVKNFQSLVEIFHVREKLASIPPLARVLSSLILAALRKDSKLESHLIPQTGKRKKSICIYLKVKLSVNIFFQGQMCASFIYFNNYILLATIVNITVWSFASCMQCLRCAV